MAKRERHAGILIVITTSRKVVIIGLPIIEITQGETGLMEVENSKKNQGIFIIIMAVKICPHLLLKKC